MDKIKKLTKYSQESFDSHRNELFIHLYDEMSKDDEILITLGEYSLDEFFAYLDFHTKVLQAAIEFHDYKIIFEHQVLFYNVLRIRKVDLRFFKRFNQIIIEQSKKYLYRSIANDIEHIYNKLQSDHDRLIKLSRVRARFIERSKIDEKLYSLIFAGNYDESLDYAKKHMNDLESFTKYFDEVLAPILFRIGSEWELGKISVAKEHLATAVVENIINSFFLESKYQSKNKKIVITTPEGEGHSLVVKVLFKVLRDLGYEVINLSNDIPNKDLIESIVELKPDFVAVSIILESNLTTLKNLVQNLKSHNDFEAKIIIGGSALRNVDNAKDKIGADYICNKLQELMQIV